MKIYYFSKSHFSEEYYLDDGALGVRRNVFFGDDKSLAKYLRDKIDLNRKSVFYVLSEDFSSSVIDNIRKFFSGSKVKVTLDSKLENN